MGVSRVCVMLEPDLWAWAQKYAKELDNRSASYIVNRALRSAKEAVEGKQSSKPAENSLKVSRKVEKVPVNFDEQFELLWVAKGRKGSKKKACEKYRSMAKGNDSEVLEQFTQMLIANIEDRNKTELGAPEQHLITYLNGQFWEY